ncbi:uncharacterized protein [Littorina saxatilis]|uniref:uncharacterized protein n=1 Tax=Littorina saxatilis TaxID=31220 RepID=UPI0038B68670
MACTTQLFHTLALFFVIATTLTSQARSSVIDVTSSNVKTMAPRRNTATEKASKHSSLFNVVDCPTRHFFSDAELVCKPCSACPANQIIRMPCAAHADTLCGPFVEFDKFHQAPVGGGEEEEEKDGGVARRGRKHHKKDHGHKKGHHHGHHKTGLPSDSEETEPEADLTSSRLEKARVQWRTLSLALVAVLSVICCLVVGVGIYVFVACRRSREHKHLLREPEFLPSYPEVDSEPRYVDTYFTSSRDRLRSPRHLPVYQHIYTGSDVTSEFPPLVTSSTTQLTKAPTKEEEEDDQYIYFNLPSVDGSEA